MKEFYYYIRDKRNRPMMTVCVIEKEAGVVAKGVALCSKSDIPCKKVGRKIAKERAVYAMINSKDSCAIGDYRGRLQLESYLYFGQTGPFKSSFLPILTDYEQSLFDFERK